jgi:hypothetical protein
LNLLDNPTQKELVENARVALELMGKDAEDAPPESKFVGARKLQNGGVVYKTSSVAMAEWLKQAETMTAFLAKFGVSLIIKHCADSVVVKYAQ